MSANRTHWFFSGQLTVDNDVYTAKDFKFNGSGLNTLKIVNDGANPLVFSVKGPDDNVEDGVVLASEEVVFREGQFHRISVKRQANPNSTTCRIWAY